MSKGHTAHPVMSPVSRVAIALGPTDLAVTMPIRLCAGVPQQRRRLSLLTWFQRAAWQDPSFQCFFGEEVKPYRCAPFFPAVRQLREELQLLQEPGSYVGEIIKVMGKKKVLCKVRTHGLPLS